MELMTQICILVLTLVVTADQTHGVQCQSSGGAVTDGEEGGNEDAINKGMEPLYTLTVGFLDLVNKNSQNKSILEEYGVKYDHGTDLEDIFTDIFDAIREDWKKALTFYIGYAVCIVIGIVFIIVFPIVGLVFCCCRCCCRQCGSKDSPTGKRDVCTRVVCGIFLALFNTIILLGMVSCFLTNELVREQTCSGVECDKRFTLTLDCGIEELRSYSHNTVQELDQLKSKLEQDLDALNNTLYDIPQSAVDWIANLTNSEAIFIKADNLSESVSRINSSLHTVMELSKILQNQAATLVSELNVEKDSLVAEIDSSCITCDVLKDTVLTLGVEQNFTELPDITAHVNQVQSVLSSDLGKLILNGREAFSNITGTVEEEIESGLRGVLEVHFTDANDVLNSVLDDTEEAYADFLTAVDDAMKTLNDTTNEIKDNEETIGKYGDYRYYACIGISCLVLLVVLFYYLGLSFGSCGEAPDEDATCCNRGVGATILMFGAAFTFIFWWLLMLILIVLFFLGGVAYTEVCRPIQKLDNSGILPFVDIAISNEETNYSVVDILNDCKYNASAYNAFKLENYINLTELLDIDGYGIRAEIDSVTDKVSNINLSSIEILNPKLETKLEELARAGLDSIDFSSFNNELSKNVTTVNLTKLINQLEQLNISTTALKQIQATNVQGIMNSSADMRAALQTLRQDIMTGGSGLNFSYHVTELLNQLRAADIGIRINGTAIIVKSAKQLGDSLYEALKTEAHSLEQKLVTDVGKCGPIYNAVDIIVNEGLCKNVLNPFNGFWFSIGWCIFFSLPCLVLAICLSGYYRRSEDYRDKTFDDPNYDAYAGPYPGDNIPLEDANRGKIYRADARQGENNTGYERDDFSQSRHLDPPRDYDDNSGGQRRRGGGDVGGYRGYGGGGNRDVPRPTAGNGFNYNSTSVPYSPPHYNNHPRHY